MICYSKGFRLSILIKLLFERVFPHDDFFHAGPNLTFIAYEVTKYHAKNATFHIAAMTFHAETVDAHIEDSTGHMHSLNLWP